MISAKTISKTAQVSKPDVYRVLAALQERGIVEKALSIPAMFKAVPIEQTLNILLQSKDKELDMLREKTEQLLTNFKRNQVKEALQERQPQFILIPEKGAELEERRKETKNAQKNMDVINSWKRFPKTLFLFAEETREALKRGVEIRMIIGKPEDSQGMAEVIRDFKKTGSLRIKYVPAPIRAVISIYDEKEVLLTTSPSASLGEVPTLWTNNLSVVTVMQEYFEMLWAKESEEED
jgi:sugar-specific transcriptional regulator TrmB